jgi:succinyl-CoA synthetase alpha subunit
MKYELRDIGFSSCVGIGGDPVIGTTHIDAPRRVRGRPADGGDRDIGEIGGDAEERAAAYIQDNVTSPWWLRRRLHRAGGQDDGPRRCDRLRLLRDGAGQEGGLEAAGVQVGRTPSETARLMREDRRLALTSLDRTRVLSSGRP